MSQDPSALLSELSHVFVKVAACAEVSRDEAMDVIRHLSVDASSTSVQQFFNILVDNGLLVPATDQRYHVVRKTRAITGVFVPFTRCYSPRCTPLSRQSCYSPTCPNQSRPIGPMRLWDPGKNLAVQDWIAALPQHLLSSLDAVEQKRQVAIAELLANEQQYCNDLDILRTVYAETLLNSSTAIEQHRRQRFHDVVFGNIDTIAQIHKKGCKALLAHRQTHFLFADRIGTTVLRHIVKLVEPYTLYAGHHVKAAYVVAVETKRNPQFRAFLEAQDGQECTRRLGLRHYLTMPTQRIGKYRLLIQAIHKRTTDDADQLALNTALAILSDLLQQMNEAARRAEIETRLLYIATSVVIPHHVPVTMKHILPDHATLLYEGELQLARSAHSITLSPCHVFLFSHVILVTRPTASDELVLAGRPIPLSMLRLGNSPQSLVGRLVRDNNDTRPSPPPLRRNTVAGSPQPLPKNSRRPNRHSSLLSFNGSVTGLHIRTRLSRVRASLSRHVKTAPDDIPPDVQDPKTDATLTRSASTKPAHTHANASLLQQTRRRMFKISHMGYPDCVYRLACASSQERETWQQHIRQALPTHPDPFELHVICEFLTSGSRHPIRIDGRVKYPTGCGRIWCTLAFESEGQVMLALGTQYGLWIGRRGMSQHYSWALGDHECKQLGIINNRILLVSARRHRRALYAYDLDTLHSPLVMSWSIRRSGVISFGHGILCGVTVLCYLTRRRHGGCVLVILACHPKDAEPTSWFRKLKEHHLDFHDATQIHVRYDRIFVLSATQGVQCIDGASLFSHPSICKATVLPLPSHKEDKYIDYVPPSVSAGILQTGLGYLCTPKHAWLIPSGQHHKQCKKIDYEAEVERFVFVHPYMIAFSPTVIEIRHTEKGNLVQTIQGRDIHCLHVSLEEENVPTVIHLSILHPSERLVRVYTLSLKTQRYRHSI